MVVPFRSDFLGVTWPSGPTGCKRWLRQETAILTNSATMAWRYSLRACPEALATLHTHNWCLTVVCVSSVTLGQSLELSGHSICLPRAGRGRGGLFGSSDTMISKALMSFTCHGCCLVPGHTHSTAVVGAIPQEATLDWKPHTLGFHREGTHLRHKAYAKVHRN